MDSVYRGWPEGGVWGGNGGGWGAESGFFHTFDWKSSHCVSTEVHKHPQFTCQADTVTGSSLTPSVALLVHPSGTAHPQWTVMNLQGHKNDASESRPVALSLVCLDSVISARVWLSCQAIIGIYQFLRDCSKFLQIQSHIVWLGQTSENNVVLAPGL